jgi:hypothetical protein
VIPIQPITIVSSGGTPMQLCDQKGAPYPTTGFGALVFNAGPTLIDAILLNPLITFDVIKLPGGDFYNPSLQFTADNSKTPGLYSTGPGNISLVGTNGDESSRALLASFDHPGNLHVANLLNIGGTIPPADSSTLVATTKWVNDQGYLTGTGAAGLYLPLVGGTLTGPLTGTTATFSGAPVLVGGTVSQASPGTGTIQALGANTGIWSIANSGGQAALGVYDKTAGHAGAYLYSAAGYAGLATIDNAGAYSGDIIHVAPTSVTLLQALTGTTATFSGAEKVMSATAIPAGGTAGAGYLFSSTANFGMIFGSGVPTAAMARGSLYLRSDGGGPYVNTDGATTWAVMGGGGGGASLTISDTPPGSPAAGAMWWNSVLGTLMVYYNDGNSSQWVPATPTMAGSYLPLAGGTLTGPLTGTLATFSGLVTANARLNVSPTLGIGVSARTSIPLDVMNLADTTGFSYVTFLRQANNPGGTNYTQFVVEQNSTNAMNIEVADQANVKGTLNLQPFGGTVNIPTLTGTTATFSGTVFAPGAQIQMVSVETGAVATGTTVIPFDDTIPQITEGDQYMTLAITPKSATSKLVISVNAVLSNSVAAVVAGALFQDSTANALAATFGDLTAVGQSYMSLAFTHVMTSGTTSPTTFRFRAGLHVAGTTTFNGQGGNRKFGGVLASSIVIREVAP